MKLKKIINKGLDFFQRVGILGFKIIANFGKYILFIISSISNFFLPPIYIRNTLKEFLEIAFFSLPIVGLTAFFTGMVLALQSYVGFARFSAEDAIANVVVLAITRELGPVLTSLMVAGRISGAIAAKIGTMKVTEQIDALYSLGVNPVKYLISPKIIAGIFALPILVFIADIIGVLGGFLAAVLQLDFNASLYLRNTWEFITYWDIVSGLIKGAVFGLIITSIGSMFGYFCSKGAIGVGKATTNSVVVASILIFVFDYILTLLFFSVN